MKAKKRSKKIIFIMFAVIIVISVYAYRTFNLDQNKGILNLSLFEKRWLEDNKNKMIDIAIPNNLPIFGKEGTGIFFSFLNDFILETELDFNMISYNINNQAPETTNAFKIVKNNQKIKENDFTFYEDNYVILSNKNLKINDLDSLNNKTIGVLTNNHNIIKNYLKKYNLTYIMAESIEQLITTFNNGEVNYIILARNAYLDDIIKNKYHVIYMFNDLSDKYVLSIDEQQNRFSSIINKYYRFWHDNYSGNNYNKEMFNIYCDINNINEEKKASFRGKRYTYGYIENIPYDLYSYGELTGINQVFIDGFANFAEIEFTYQKYNNVGDLQEAIRNNEVDLVFNYYNFSKLGDNIYSTIAPINSDYLVLAHIRNNMVIDSLQGLNNKDINMIRGTKLLTYINKNIDVNFHTYESISNLKNENENLLVIDYNTYQYHKNRQLKKYNIIYQDTIDFDYNYLVNNNNENKLFYDLYQFYLNNINHNQYVLTGINNLLLNYNVINLSFLWLYIILIPFLIIIMGIIVVKRKKMRAAKKYNAVKHIDPLTSLKNRYYLNNNIKNWEDNKVYPQTVIIIDLNNLKEINDNYGHDEGDRLIKATANILINNQLENTDIIRTDGNEFLIYMVGYDENQVIDHIRKLERIFKELPYDRGVAIGYSMIMDDIKLIDDAINEAVLEMLTNKETKKRDSN